MFAHHRVPMALHSALQDDLLRVARGWLPRATVRRRAGKSMTATQRRLLALMEQYGPLCHWCRKLTQLDVERDHPDRATVEHLVPKAKGGSNKIGNLRVACYACNQARGDDPTWTPSGSSSP